MSFQSYSYRSGGAPSGGASTISSRRVGYVSSAPKAYSVYGGGAGGSTRISSSSVRNVSSGFGGGYGGGYGGGSGGGGFDLSCALDQNASHLNEKEIGRAHV